MSNKSLPVWSVMDLVIGSLNDRRNVVLASPTGSGKSTQVPQALYEAAFASKGMIIISQPRRMACRAVAKRVADELGVKLGAEVGYWVRMDNCTSPETRICFMTDGLLLRLIEEDRTLSKASIVVFDEFHERRVASDVALGLMRDLQSRRADLRLMVMSATMDPGRVVSYLDADRFIAEGKSHNVDIVYSDREIQFTAMHKAVVETVERVCSSDKPGDVLVFLPGKYLIDECYKELDARRLRDVALFRLHGELPKADQDAVLWPASGRKVILSTNVAETSLTIPGVSIVIDSGFERRVDFDPETGADRMSTARITNASALQRAGRAGRERPGYCFRLWTKAEQKQLEPYLTPDIRRKDVADVILSLKAAGVEHPASFPLLDSPTPDQYTASERLLRLLGALDEDGNLTQIGWRMQRLPPALGPRFSRMVVEAERRQCVIEVATLAALMTGKAVEVVPMREKQKAVEVLRNFVRDPSCDFLTQLEIYEQAMAAELHPQWCRDHYVNADALHFADYMRTRILTACAHRGSKFGPPHASLSDLLYCFATGLPDRLAMRQKDGQYRLCSGPMVKLHKGTAITNQQFVLAGRIIFVASDKSDGDIGRISDLSAVNMELMEELFPSLVKRSHTLLEWNAEKGMGRIGVGRRYGSLDLGMQEKLVDRDHAIDVVRLEELEAKEAGWQRAEVRNHGGKLTARFREKELPVHSNGMIFDGSYWISIIQQGESELAILERRIVQITKADAPVLANRSSLKGALNKLLGD